jgi:hypothetical protein
MVGTSFIYRFWAAIKSKKQESTGVSPLKNKEGFIHSDTTSKAEILNEQFQSIDVKAMGL